MMPRSRNNASESVIPPPVLLKRIVRVLALLCIVIAVLTIFASLWGSDGDPQLFDMPGPIGLVDAFLVISVFKSQWIVYCVGLLTGVGVLLVTTLAERTRRPTLLWVGCLVVPLAMASLHTGGLVASQLLRQAVETPERTYVLDAPGLVLFVSVVYAALAGLGAASLVYVVMYGGRSKLPGGAEVAPNG